MRNLRVFEYLVGHQNMQCVILVTSLWANVSLKVAEVREKELRQHDLFGSLLARGATQARSLGTRESALVICERFIRRGEQRLVLHIQHELVDEAKVLKDTAAGGYLDEEIQKLSARWSDEKVRTQATWREYRTEPGKPSSGRYSSDTAASSEAAQAGNREDLNAKWNPDYGSLWLVEGANTPPKWDSQLYGTLNDGDFRLVELRAGRGVPIEVSLITERISDPPPYSALSYAVGHDQRQTLIQLRYKNTLHNIHVGENLYTALKHLRRITALQEQHGAFDSVVLLVLA